VLPKPCQKTPATFMSQNNKHRGDDFRDFLNEEGILCEVETRALKRAVNPQLNRPLEKQNIPKAEMSARIKTTRSLPPN
jgi:antitoxin HicB